MGTTQLSNDTFLKLELLRPLTSQLRVHDQQAVGVLRLDSALKVDAKQEVELLIDDAREQPSLPAESCRRDGDAGNRVSRVVVTVPNARSPYFMTRASRWN